MGADAYGRPAMARACEACMTQTDHDCNNCAEAADNALWGGYTADCQGCQVRMFASGPMFNGCENERRILPEYKTAMQAVFGESWRDRHEDVKAESQRIKGANAGR